MQNITTKHLNLYIFYTSGSHFHNDKTVEVNSITENKDLKPGARLSKAVYTNILTRRQATGIQSFLFGPNG